MDEGFLFEGFVGEEGGSKEEMDVGADGKRWVGNGEARDYDEGVAKGLKFVQQWDVKEV